MWQHDCVVSGWSDPLKELHIPHQTEPKRRYLNSEDRPDISAFNINNGINFDFDIAMAHPFSEDTVKRASEEMGHGQKRRNRERFSSTKKIMPTGGVPSLFH